MTEGNGYAGRDAFLSHAKKRYAEEEIRGVGTVRIQSVSGKEHDQIAAMVTDDDDNVDMLTWRAAWIAACIVNVDGKRIFADNDIDTINDFDSRILLRLYSAVSRHVGLGADTVEELEKNSEGTATDSSPSDSLIASGA
jgi:hypothetical protein